MSALSPSALALTVIKPGSAAHSAEVCKNLKYEGLCDRYIFQAITIESTGVFGQDTGAFVSRLDHLTTSISGELCVAEFLCQCLSLATVHGNAQSVTPAHELGLPCGICELHFLIFTQCIFHLGEIRLFFLHYSIIIVNVICIVIMMVENKMWNSKRKQLSTFCLTLNYSY